MFKQLVVLMNFILCALLLSGCEEQKRKLNSSLDTIYKELAPFEELIEPKEFNPDYRFEFDACSLKINGQEFHLNDPLGKWVLVLGSYSKKKGRRYYWDDLGFRLTVADPDIVTSPDGALKFQFSKDSTDDYILEKMEFVDRTEKDFQGAVSVQGILIDKNLDYKVLNRQRREKGLETFGVGNISRFGVGYRCDGMTTTFKFDYNRSIEPYPSVITYFSVH
jgi:hypothetical protein